MSCGAQGTDGRIRATDAPYLAGPDGLRQSVLFPRWYILHRLDEAIELARRYHRPLSVTLVAMTPLGGEWSNAAKLAVAGAAAQATARSTDVLGWLDCSSFLIIMPETKPTDGAAALSRWRAEVWSRSRYMGGHEWRFVQVESTGAFATAERLIQGATQRLAQKEAV